MKSVSLIVIVVLLVFSTVVSAGDDRITSTEIEDLVYQFDYTVGNATDYRWSFGDGATSIEVSPVHEFPNHQTFKVVCEVTFADDSTQSDEIIIDATMPLLDAENGTVNVGDVTVAGGLLFVSCFLMFALASSGNHIGSDILGKGGKDVICFLYGIGMITGFYLVFNSLFGGI